MMKNNVRERIIKTLKEHPEGLKINDISSILGMNRLTVSKYVYGLISEKMIYERKIGPSKLCYLKVRK
jgi:DNA-binding IclR family transcriptional regulator